MIIKDYPCLIKMKGYVLLVDSINQKVYEKNELIVIFLNLPSIFVVNLSKKQRRVGV